MVRIARNIAARGAVNGDTRIDFIKIPVAPVFKPECFLGRDPRSFVFGDFSRFLIGLMAKRPSPVNERPTRNDLRGISD